MHMTLNFHSNRSAKILRQDYDGLIWYDITLEQTGYGTKETTQTISFFGENSRTEIPLFEAMWQMQEAAKKADAETVESMLADENDPLPEPLEVTEITSTEQLEKFFDEQVAVKPEHIDASR